MFGANRALILEQVSRINAANRCSVLIEIRTCDDSLGSNCSLRHVLGMYALQLSINQLSTPVTVRRSLLDTRSVTPATRAVCRADSDSCEVLADIAYSQ